MCTWVGVQSCEMLIEGALARALARTILVDGLSTTTAVQHATAVRDTPHH